MSCTSCGEYTTKRHAFGHLICDRCYEAEDDEVEAYDRAQARRHGYGYGWSDDQREPAKPTKD